MLIYSGTNSPTIRPQKVLLELAHRTVDIATPISMEITVTKNYRFGRRIPIPSTVQILHDLKALTVQEEGRNYAPSLTDYQKRQPGTTFVLTAQIQPA